MSVKVERVSEYLNNFGGATIEKVKEISGIVDFTREYTSPEIKVEIHNEGAIFSYTLDYFHPSENVEIPDKIDFIDNLLYTIQLDTPEQVFITRPDGKVIGLIEDEETETLNVEFMEEIKDIKGKLDDCIETLNYGKQLDSTQNAFLKMHNIID